MPSQIASIGDVNTCTFLTNLATTGPAVYAFNCAGRINTNAFANQPVDAVRAWQQLQSLSSEALSRSQLALGLTSRKGTPTAPGKTGSVTVLQVPASLRFSELPTVDRCERAPRTMCGHPAPRRRWPLITPSASPRSRSPREHSPYPARLWRPAPVLAPPVQQPLRARIRQASAADAERSRSTAASPTDAFLMLTTSRSARCRCSCLLQPTLERTVRSASAGALLWMQFCGECSCAQDQAAHCPMGLLQGLQAILRYPVT